MHFPKVRATAPFTVPTISTILLRWKYPFGKFKPDGCRLTVDCIHRTPPSLRSREGPGVSLDGWQLSVASCGLPSYQRYRWLSGVEARLSVGGCQFRRRMHFPKVRATAPFTVPTISTILLRWKYTFGKFKPDGHCSMLKVGEEKTEGARIANEVLEGRCLRLSKVGA
jgi:hypothetical protein